MAAYLGPVPVKRACPRCTVEYWDDRNGLCPVCQADAVAKAPGTNQWDVDRVAKDRAALQRELEAKSLDPARDISSYFPLCVRCGGDFVGWFAVEAKEDIHMAKAAGVSVGTAIIREAACEVCMPKFVALVERLGAESKVAWLAIDTAKATPRRALASNRKLVRDIRAAMLAVNL